MSYLLTAIWRLCFYPAKFDNYKHEKMLDYKTVSVAQSKNFGTENCQAEPIISNFWGQIVFVKIF